MQRELLSSLSDQDTVKKNNDLITWGDAECKSIEWLDDKVFQAEIVYIMAVHNSQKTILRAVESVLCQKCTQSFALVLLDDRSQDDWKDRLKDYLSDHRLVIASCFAGTSYKIRNLGKKIVDTYFTQYSWLCRLDSDDTLVSEYVISDMSSAIEKHPGSPLWVLAGNLQNEKGVFKNSTGNRACTELLSNSYLLDRLRGMSEGNQSCELPSCNLWIKKGLNVYYPPVSSAEDHHLVSRLLILYKNEGCVLPDILHTNYLLSGTITTQNKNTSVYFQSRKKLYQKAVGWIESKICYVDIIGCEKRKLDAERIIKYMEANQYTVMTDDLYISKANILIFITCSFNDEFNTLSREKILDLNSNKAPDSKLIISGCLPQIDPDFLKNNNIYDYTGPRDLTKLDKIINSNIEINGIPEQNISCFDEKKYPVPNKEFNSAVYEDYRSAKKGYKIRVCWGCLSSCSYCKIKKATGTLKSKELHTIQSELETGIKKGYNTFFITGGDVGAYGVDLKKNVTHLLELLCSYKDINIYIQEFNIQWILKYKRQIVDILLNNLNCYNKIFIMAPIQSGSNKILKLMKRNYSIHEISPAINELRKENPKLRIGSHFIIGYTGEEDEDFQLTYDLIKSLRLDFALFFPYNPGFNKNALQEREKSRKIIEHRIKQLLVLQKEIDIEENRFEKQISISSKKIDQIEGWLTKKEGDFLYTMATKNKGDIVEIGAWKGLSSFYLASGLKETKNGGYLYSVDHFQGSREHQERCVLVNTYPEFIANIKKFNVADRIKIMKMSSEKAASEIDSKRISLIFIDGSHEYKDVKADFHYWWPKLNTGGHILFHDSISKPGVEKFIDELLQSEYTISEPYLLHDLICFKKNGEKNPCTLLQFRDFKNKYKQKIMKMKNEGLIKYT